MKICIYRTFFFFFFKIWTNQTKNKFWKLFYILLRHPEFLESVWYCGRKLSQIKTSKEMVTSSLQEKENVRYVIREKYHSFNYRCRNFPQDQFQKQEEVGWYSRVDEGKILCVTNRSPHSIGEWVASLTPKLKSLFAALLVANQLTDPFLKNLQFACVTASCTYHEISRFWILFRSYTWILNSQVMRGYHFITQSKVVVKPTIIQN